MSTFQNKNLAVIAYANGATIWHYIDRKLESNDIDLEKFFKPIYNLCSVGDKIIVVCKDLYFEAIIVKLRNGNVICKSTNQVEFSITQEED